MVVFSCRTRISATRKQKPPLHMTATTVPHSRVCFAGEGQSQARLVLSIKLHLLFVSLEHAGGPTAQGVCVCIQIVGSDEAGQGSTHWLGRVHWCVSPVLGPGRSFTDCGVVSCKSSLDKKCLMVLCRPLLLSVHGPQTFLQPWVPVRIRL